ncbi:beta-2-microglobulin-like [Pungitius pungitius]|uniref:beta-2-microglobulin-like n=1 Tax=Pungitius pungitius TaxID=134920 RepID=UPI001889B10B|nr:beta-2-microglobulin-like [Pungitius pungitius]
MMLLLTLAALLTTSFGEDPTHTPPKVQVYSHHPGEFDKENTLICHVSGFHPPDITIQLMKDNEEIPNAKQTDLAFKQGWRFVLTKNVAFTPMRGEKYSCKVTHGTTVRDYAWESNM